MKKIPTLFRRNYEGDYQVYDEVTPGCEWVLAGEGVATIKVDGTACLIRDGKLYKRYTLKKGKTPPPDFEPADETNPFNGEQPGWVPVGDGKEDAPYHEPNRTLEDGTYELIGPKVNGNPYDLVHHYLVRHSFMRATFSIPPRTYDELKKWLGQNVLEGIVWHHPDGRMVKLKRRDFGYPWPIPKKERA